MRDVKRPASDLTDAPKVSACYFGGLWRTTTGIAHRIKNAIFNPLLTDHAPKAVYLIYQWPFASEIENLGHRVAE
jgi:hypothetical protein